MKHNPYCSNVSFERDLQIINVAQKMTAAEVVKQFDFFPTSVEHIIAAVERNGDFQQWEPYHDEFMTECVMLLHQFNTII